MNFDNHAKPFVLLAGILFAFRVWLGRVLSIWFPADQYYDDGLMMRYADLYNHFVVQSDPFNEALLKDMGFPLFLNFVHVTGLQYTDILAILWLIAAVLFAWLFFKLTRISNPIILFAVYTFVLFTPAAFDFWCGTRLYRAGLLTPLYCICMNMMMILVVRHFEDVKLNLEKFLVFQIVLGIFFTFTFYVKEDGIWLLCCLIVALGICLIKSVLQKSFDASAKIFHIAILILPLVIFFGGTTFYKMANYKFFSVYEINTRTDGELGKFLKLVYKIQSDGRTSTVWASKDAVQKAFEVSETLRGNDKLKDSVMHSKWLSGDINKYPIVGDFLGWIMIDAVKDSGTCHNAVEQENYFRQVNREIEAAFDDGRLQKDSRFQLTSAMGGRDLKGLFDLRKLTASVYRIHVMTYKYTPGALEYALSIPNNSYEESLMRRAIDLTNTNLLERRENFETVNLFVRILFILYALIQTLFFFMALVGIYWGVREIYRRRIKLWSGEFLTVSITAGNFLLSLVYAAAVAWFCEAISDHETRYAALKFYSVGAIPMLTTIEIFGAYLFYLRRKSRKGM